MDSKQLKDFAKKHNITYDPKSVIVSNESESFKFIEVWMVIVGLAILATLAKHWF